MIIFQQLIFINPINLKNQPEPQMIQQPQLEPNSQPNPKPQPQSYPNPFHLSTPTFELTSFLQQSDNCELIIGKIIIKPKKPIPPLQLMLQLSGIYRIWDIPKKDVHMSHESHIDFSETLSQFENVETRRKDGTIVYSNQVMERQESFMDGEQKIAQIDQTQFSQPNAQIVYPFIFNIPPNLPPTQQAIYFSNKRIQIKYSLTITARENTKSAPLLKNQSQIPIRRLGSTQIPPKLCKILQYRCYTRFFCACLGTYHLQLNSTVLHPGKMQIEGRLFRQGKTTQNIVSSIQVLLYGQLKKVKKVLISEKKMVMRLNEYEMYEGEVILSYDSGLRSFQSQLLTVRFWVECRLEFRAGVWKFQKRNFTGDVIL